MSSRPRLGLPSASVQEVAIASLIEPHPDVSPATTREEEAKSPTVGFVGYQPPLPTMTPPARPPVDALLPESGNDRDSSPHAAQGLAVVPQPIVVPPGAPHVLTGDRTVTGSERNRGGRPRGPRKERIHYYVLQSTSNIIDETFRRGRHPVSGRKFSSPSEVIDAIVQLRHASFLVVD